MPQRRVVRGHHQGRPRRTGPQQAAHDAGVDKPLGTDKDSPAGKVAALGADTVEDVLASRMVAEPLRMLEIVMPVAGGAAFVVTREDIARRCRHRPVPNFHQLRFPGHQLLPELLDILPVGTQDQQPVDFPLQAFQLPGIQTLLEYLERETWHTGQHTRQVMMFMEQLGIPVDRPLGPEVFAGLPMPERVWD